jgi:hypothetical protein
VKIEGTLRMGCTFDNQGIHFVFCVLLPSLSIVKEQSAFDRSLLIIVK